MLRTWNFAISFLGASTPVAHGLICLDPRYVGIRWRDGRLDRRHIPDAVWQMLTEELRRSLVKGPVGRSTAISAVMVGSMGAIMSVAFLDEQQLTARNGEDVERLLDMATRQGQPA